LTLIRAVELDALVAEATAFTRELPGFAKVTRKVCKAEWDYEATVVFEGSVFCGRARFVGLPTSASAACWYRGRFD